MSKIGFWLAQTTENDSKKALSQTLLSPKLCAPKVGATLYKQLLHIKFEITFICGYKLYRERCGVGGGNQFSLKKFSVNKILKFSQNFGHRFFCQIPKNPSRELHKRPKHRKFGKILLTINRSRFRCIKEIFEKANFGLPQT